LLIAWAHRIEAIESQLTIHPLCDALVLDSFGSPDRKLRVELDGIQDIILVFCKLSDRGEDWRE
jgi:hypothetical protein